ncbi:Uncharacterized protein HZ326_9151 [Fusarium oxysporum f. sp. albedinis]|nr:Uncharacterized protein HZ326_9151 [Fusarium oxysporum f. sp. albedinis]
MSIDLLSSLIHIVNLSILLQSSWPIISRETNELLQSPPSSQTNMASSYVNVVLVDRLVHMKAGATLYCNTGGWL